MEFSQPLLNLDITSKFGNRVHPITNSYSFHNGIDLRAVQGTPVYSILPGTVDQVYYNDIGGNQITIEHPEGFRSGYAHLKDTLIDPGQSVYAGQLIGYSGNTGASTGAHLHFTLKKEGNYIDPESIDYSITEIVKKKMVPYTLGLILSGLFLFLYLKK